MNEVKTTIDPSIEASWKRELKSEFEQQSFHDLKAFLKEEKKNYNVFPPGSHIFSAFDHTPFDRVNVVIIGQDPYHGDGQAHGLCFSVPQGIRIPPSLENIFKEIKEDLGYEVPPHGNLESWADQGVLLLNATLTVRAHQAGSHQNKGWEPFTDAVIRKISDQKDDIVFMLWGRFAQQKAQMIDLNRHYVLTAAHPSPFSAHNGFFGCRHFSKANAFLKSKGKPPIRWNLT